ncbi:hypothetical protein ACO1DI_12455 [Priestia sp. 40]
MNLMKLLSGDGFVMYNREIAHEVSVNGSIIFGQLCSSYSYFENRDELTNIDGKNHFYITSEKLTEYTALSYKQQAKAIKELERAGYIETKLKGLPAVKYFHIVIDKLVNNLMNELQDKNDEVKPSIAERENLNISTISEDETSATIDMTSFDKREELDMPKGEDQPVQKVTEIINTNKTSKIKDKDIVNKKKAVNNQSTNSIKISQDEIIHKLCSEFMSKGMNKSLCLRVVEEAKKKKNVDNFGAYLRTCLQNTLYKSQLKNGQLDLSDKFGNSSMLFYNFLNDDEE